MHVLYRISNQPPRIGYDLDFEPIWQYNCPTYNCRLREIGGRDMLARPTQIVRHRGDAAGGESPLIEHLADEHVLKSVYRKEGWNDLSIRAVGSRMIHRLNGVTMVDCSDEDERNRRLGGGIRFKIFLYYGPWVEARFRNIRLRDLV